MLATFLHYRSPSLSKSGMGESLRARDVASAYERSLRMISTCTDATAASEAQLRIHKADDEADDAPPAVVAEANGSLGAGELVRLETERYWEWRSIDRSADHAARVGSFVAFNSANDHLPKIWTNPTLRRHDVPRRPRVDTIVTWNFRLRDPETGAILPLQEAEHYLPGWSSPSSLALYLGSNRISLVLKFPFASETDEFSLCVGSIENALGHSLSRSRFRCVQLNSRGDGYVERKLS